MRILAVAQTRKEVQWAVAEARREDGNSWTVLLLGDAAPPAHPGNDCRMLTLADAGFSPEEAWLDCRRLQEELWKPVGTSGTPALALAGQWFVADRLLTLVIAEGAVAAAIRSCDPDLVRIPPPGSRREATEPLALANLHEIVRQTASRLGVECRPPSLFLIFDRLESFRTFILRVSVYLVAAMRDAAVLACWVVGRLPQQPLSSRDAIIFCNSGTDLERQFKCHLPDTIQARSLSWNHEEGSLGLFSAGRGTTPRGGGIRGRIKALYPAHVGRLRPTMMTPMLLSPGIPWFCTQTGRPPKGISQRLHCLLGATAFVGPRLLDFRRYVNSVRSFAQMSDVIRATEPALVVTGDTFFLDRAATLAARAQGVRTLATSHAIQMFSENFFEFYNLAQTHAVFHPLSTVVGGADHPLFPGRRVVFHDALPRPSPSPAPNRGRRIIIFTSAWSLRGGWANEALIDLRRHDSSLHALVAALLASHPATHVLLKPHPTGEPHVVHNQIMALHPDRVFFSREPLPLEGAIAADVAIFYNCVSTAFFQVASRGIPIICHRGALTPLARRLFGTNALLGAEDAMGAAQLVAEILESPTGKMAKEARAAVERTWNAHIQPSQGGLTEVVEAALRA